MYTHDGVSKSTQVKIRWMTNKKKRISYPFRSNQYIMEKIVVLRFTILQNLSQQITNELQKNIILSFQ